MKFSLTLIIVLFLLTGVSFSESVKKIQVSGNDRISKEAIIVFGDIKKNQSYDEQGINELIKRLYGTNFFSYIDITLEKEVLKIRVEENPIINLVIFKGIKADKFKQQILDHMELKQKTSFSKHKVKGDINLIKLFFRSKGFYFVELEAEVQELSGNRINIIYTVDLGKRAKIEKIFFIGDKKIKDSKLRRIITSEESKFWKFISQSKYLNAQRLKLDERLLKNYYRNKGYYEVEVNSSNVEYSEGEGFILTFNINAGKRYRFKKAYVNVSEDLEKEPFLGLNKDFKEIVGTYYSPKKLTDILNKIDKLSSQKELQFINYKLFETLEDDYVVVRIDVFEGKKFFVERINVVGNNVTNESVIRSEMITDEGDPYSALLLNKSINNLKARNLFANVKYKVLPGSSKDVRIIEVQVEEKATGEIAAGAGVGTDGGSFTFSVKENNFLGTGVRLDTSFELSEETIRGRFSVNNPNFQYSGNALSTTAESIKIDKLSASGYETTRTGLSLGTTFEQYENFYISPNFSTYYEDVSTNSTASSKVKKMAGSFFSTNFAYGLTLDKRNQKFQTTDGYKVSFNQRLPIYADSPSILNGFDYVTYKPLTDDIVGSIRFYSRAINAVGDEDVKISQRLHIPSRYLKGFKSGKVGPIDNDDHVGGNYAAALGFNAALPNLLPQDLNTDVSLFLDTGNVWAVDYDSSLNDSNALRSSFGVTASMFTPIGPLSITFAQDLAKKNTDQTESFRFNLGTTF